MIACLQLCKENSIKNQNSAVQKYQKSPKGRYATQKANAKLRNIDWQMSFETWWKIWEDSGHWEERGGKGGYYMCRFNDTGSYNPKNVEIKTASENAKEYWKLRKIKENVRVLDPFRSFPRHLLPNHEQAWAYKKT